MTDPTYDYEACWDHDYDEDGSCTVCGGEAYVECDDPIQCMQRHLRNDWDQFCPCKACGGTGLAKDQTIW